MSVSSAEETALGVDLDHAERLSQRIGFGTLRIAVPLEISTLPEEPPLSASPHKSDFSDRTLHHGVRVVVPGSHKEQFDAVACEALSFANLLAQMQRRAPLRPKQ